MSDAGYEKTTQTSNKSKQNLLTRLHYRQLVTWYKKIVHMVRQDGHEVDSKHTGGENNSRFKRVQKNTVDALYWDQ